MHVFPNVTNDAHATVTWYPHSGLLAYRQQLYFVCAFDERTLEQAVSIHASAHIMYDRHCAIAVWFPDIAQTGAVTNYRKTLIIGSSRFITERPIRNLITNPQIWTRAQRWLRKVLRPKLVARNLAFAMGLHGRLGENSILSAVTPDVAEMIIKKIGQK